jgi:hypothetical protein
MKLQASPAASGTPKFSFGCGKSDGTSSCGLGAVDPGSTHRQLQAQVTVPVTASAVNSVSLTVTGTAAQLPKAAKVSAAVAITAPKTPATTPTSATAQPAQPAPGTPPLAPQPPPAPLPPMTVTSPLPVGSLPGIPAADPGPVPGPVPTPSQSGDAAGLFPTLNPSPQPTPQLGFPTAGGASRISDISALPEGASVANAQLAGLAALALAFILTVTRLSIRRPAKQPAGNSGSATETGRKPDDKPGTDGKPGAPNA